MMLQTKRVRMMATSFTILLSVLTLYSSSVDGNVDSKDDNSNRMRTSQVCQARCLARCRDEGLPEYCTNECEIFRNDEWMPKCIEKMKKSNSTIVGEKGESAACIETCFNLNNETGPVQVAPSISQESSSNVTFSLEWWSNEGRARGHSAVYLVERRRVGDKRWTPWAETWNQNYTVPPSQVTEDEVCTLYEFRVSAVNRFGQSPYSDPVQMTRDYLPKPGPVEGIKLLHAPYYDQSSRNIHATITWRTPKAWLGLADFSRLPTYTKQCPLQNSVPASPIFLYDNLLKRLKFRVHESAVGCEFHVAIRLFSRCMVAGEPDTIDVDLTDCKNIKNFVCPSKRPRPPGPVRDIKVKVTDHVIGVTWSEPSDLGSSGSIAGYEVRWGPVDRSSLFPTLKEENSTALFESETSLQFKVTHPGTDYGVQIVATSSADEQIAWGLYPFTPFTVPPPQLTPVLFNTSSLPEVQEKRMAKDPFPPVLPATAWYILVPVLLLILLVTLVLVVARRRRKLQHLNQPITLTERLNLYNQMGDRDESPPASPTRVPDRWEIPHAAIDLKQELGEGAFGHVFYAALTLDFAKGRDDVIALLTNQNEEEVPVAVKKLHNFADKQQKQEFRREIELMKTLGQHANVVSIVGCCTLSDPLCLVVEHMPNGDLLKYLRKHRYKMQNHDFASVEEEYYETQAKLTYADLLNFARQIARGMEFLSQKGFVHRDLACRNILVGENHTVKVGDFGLTRYVYDDQERVYVHRKGGKLPLKWMSLEAIFDLSFTYLSDVWSFGIVLFEITTLGGTPYPGLHNKEFLHRLKAGYRMERPDGCDTDLYQLMRRCWQTRPRDRPDFSALCGELEKLIQHHSNTDYLDMALDLNQMYYNAPVLDSAASDDDDIGDILSLHENETESPMWRETESPEWRERADSPLWPGETEEGPIWALRKDLPNSETRDSWNDPLNMARSSGSSGRDSMGTKAASDDAFEDVYPPDFRRQDSGNVSYEHDDMVRTSSPEFTWLGVTTV